MLVQWVFTAQDHLPAREGTGDVLKKAGKELCDLWNPAQNKNVGFLVLVFFFIFQKI